MVLFLYSGCRCYVEFGVCIPRRFSYFLFFRKPRFTHLETWHTFETRIRDEKRNTDRQYTTTTIKNTSWKGIVWIAFCIAAFHIHHHYYRYRSYYLPPLSYPYREFPPVFPSTYYPLPPPLPVSSHLRNQLWIDQQVVYCFHTQPPTACIDKYALSFPSLRMQTPDSSGRSRD